MAETTDVTDSPGSESQPDRTADMATGLLRRFPRFGVLAWSFVGIVVAGAIVVTALAAVSEIVLPLTFAAVLAVVFKPLVGVLTRRGWRPTLAACVVVVGLVVLMAGVVVATVKGIVDQTDEITESVDAAIGKAADDTDALNVDEAALEEARAAINEAAPTVKSGALAGLVSVVDSLIAIAGGVILGTLIMYYMLKDGTRLRRSVVAQFDATFRDDADGFIGDACRSLRDYGKGRTIMSAIVSAVVGLAALLLGLPLVFTIVVVNFIGGYIPYVGAFLGGGLAVIIALGDGGLGKGVIMLAVVLAANLALENFVEPKVMGRSLDMHPLVVLVVTALGGLLGGIVGLILAVPAWAIAGNAINRLRSRGVLERVAQRAEPTVRQVLD